MDSNSRGILLGLVLGVLFLIGAAVVGFNWGTDRIVTASLPIEAPYHVPTEVIGWSVYFRSSAVYARLTDLSMGGQRVRLGTRTLCNHLIYQEQLGGVGVEEHRSDDGRVLAHSGNRTHIQTRRGTMRKIILAALALTSVAVAAPASAQGIYFGGPGVSVGIGAPAHRYYDGPVYHSYDYDTPRYRSYDRSYAYGGCRTITIQRDNGTVKRIRRCG